MKHATFEVLGCERWDNEEKQESGWAKVGKTLIYYVIPTLASLCGIAGFIVMVYKCYCAPPKKPAWKPGRRNIKTPKNDAPTRPPPPAAKPSTSKDDSQRQNDIESQSSNDSDVGSKGFHMFPITPEMEDWLRNNPQPELKLEKIDQKLKQSFVVPPRRSTRLLTLAELAKSDK